MRLALKFTLAFLISMGCVLAVYAYAVMRREIDLFEEDLKTDQSMLAYALALGVREQWDREGEDAALAFVERANRSEAQNRVSVRWVWLDAPSGDRFAPHVSEAQMRALKQGQEVVQRDMTAGRYGVLYTYTPMLVPGRGMGAVEVSESLEEYRLYARATVLNIAFATAVLAAISALLSMLLGVRFVGRPVSQLIGQAREVAAGRFETRLRFREHDELAVLAGEFNGMCEQLAVARDRVAAETAARIATIEQLRHADRLKTVGQLASGIAHELGTPLNIVRARAKMVTADAGASASAASNAQIIVEQSDRMTNIIRQLLDFARPRTPRRLPTDLREVVQRTVSLLHSAAGKHKVEILARLGDEPLVADADPDQLQQVLSNLLLNGMQAMPGGGRLSVDGRRERVRPPAEIGGPDAEYLCLSVRDEGEGISAENLNRLFEPFFTTKQVGEGVGLGLSVSRGIVHEHGGWIGVESREGEGSCFSVYLPGRSDDAGPNPDRR